MILIEEESFKELLLKMERIENYLTEFRTSNPNQSNWISNEEACKILNVTPRTMQNYRDNGIISFSKVGSKIYYRLNDLEEHLESHFHTAFNNERRQS